MSRLVATAKDILSVPAGTPAGPDVGAVGIRDSLNRFPKVSH